MTSVCVQQHRLCRKIVSVACMIKLRDKGVRCIAGRKSNAPRAVRNRVRKRQGRFITSLMASELLSFNAENKSWTIWEFLCCAALGPNLDVRNAQTCIIMKNRVETTTMILLMEINWFRSYYFFIAAPRNSLRFSSIRVSRFLRHPISSHTLSSDIYIYTIKYLFSPNYGFEIQSFFKMETRRVYGINEGRNHFVNKLPINK